MTIIIIQLQNNYKLRRRETTWLASEKPQEVASNSIQKYRWLKVKKLGSWPRTILLWTVSETDSFIQVREKIFEKMMINNEKLAWVRAREHRAQKVGNFRSQDLVNIKLQAL